VLLISADLRRMNLHELFGIENNEGLSDVLTGLCGMEDVTQAVYSVPGLSVVSSGFAPRRPTDLLASAKMREVVTAARDSYDYVILDTPPVLSVADCLALSTYVDGVLMAVKGRVTRASALDHARAQLTAVGASLLGAVVWNMTPAADDPYYDKPPPSPPLSWEQIGQQASAGRAAISSALRRVTER
jgi:capsular exopolysaccharide synthesis family protein